MFNLNELNFNSQATTDDKISVGKAVILLRDPHLHVLILDVKHWRVLISLILWSEPTKSFDELPPKNNISRTGVENSWISEIITDLTLSRPEFTTVRSFPLSKIRK